MSDPTTNETDRLEYLGKLLPTLRDAADKVRWERHVDNCFKASLAGRMLHLSDMAFAVEEHEGGAVLLEWRRKDPVGAEARVASLLTSLYWRVRRQVALGEGALQHLLAEAELLAKEPQP